ncbi:hypothetical protein FV242_01755 [Methylobacterium sp. WL64]|uniref:hypothetical protein n=1 Tax=Methylobacterium sp. WL64 TaxID=2603894 RepID=UPI0011C9F63C|nr:hypothetical protein [Methylobacterium sp. WL64]TXN05922.1 hypothetical protein FV242_01755 [Methylobacterium sp. WL64]
MAVQPKPAAAPAPRPSSRVLAKAKSASAAAQRIHQPPLPTVSATEDKAAHEDQQTSRVEMLMLKGVTRPELIGQLLELNTRTVIRLIERVHARWEITGGGRTITRFRGEAMARLDLLEQETWAKYAALSNRKEPSPKDEARMLKLLLDISGQRNALLGLSPKVVERLGLTPDQPAEVLARLTAQRGLAQMAIRLTELLAERRAAVGETIDHDEE